MPTLGKRDAQLMLKLVKEAREAATMQTAFFDHPTYTPTDDQRLPQTEQEVTPFIKARTRVWRNSWIIGQLDAVQTMLAAMANEDTESLVKARRQLREWMR